MNTAVPPRLIVTRPQPQASAWAHAVATRSGWACQALPLIQTHALAIDPSRLQPADAWMFVSAAAVQAWWALGSAEPAPTIWVTGGGSSDALRAHGFSGSLVLPGSPAQWDSEGLWAALELQNALLGVRRVRVLRGRDAGAAHEGNGREWLSERLRARGIAVETVAVYERRAPLWTAVQCDAARAALADGSVWLFTSSQAVEHLLSLVPSVVGARALATHRRVAERARAAGFSTVAVCEPGLDAIALWCESNRSLLF